MFGLHPLTSTYPGASFFPNGNLNGPHLALQSGGPSQGYWGSVPWEIPEMPEWDLPPAIKAMQEGRGTGMYGITPEGGGQGQPFNYGWPRYGPMPLRPELGGLVSMLGKYAKKEWADGEIVGKCNPYGRSWPHGYYKTTY